MGPKNPKSSSIGSAVQRKTDFSRDISLLLTRATIKETLIIRLLAETGVQLKELVNLKKTSLRGRKLTISSRTAILSTELAHALANYTRTQPHKYIFSSRQSAKLTTRRVEQLIKGVATKANVHVTARDIRKAYLAAAAQQAKNTEELKELTGLKSITKERVLTEKEQERLTTVLKKQPARDKALVKTILEIGLSLQETLTITRKDISSLTISAQLDSQLRTLAKKPEEYLFSSRQSTKLTTRRAEQIIATIGRKAKLELTSQVLRTTALRGGAL